MNHKNDTLTVPAARIHTIVLVVQGILTFAIIWYLAAPTDATVAMQNTYQIRNPFDLGAHFFFNCSGLSAPIEEQIFVFLDVSVT